MSCLEKYRHFISVHAKPYLQVKINFVIFYSFQYPALRTRVENIVILVMFRGRL